MSDPSADGIPPASSLTPPAVVFKFGGSSVGTPERFRRMIDVITATAEHGRVVVIVSALSNVTRQLSAALEAFTTTPDDPQAVVDELVDTLRDRHRTHAEAVLAPQRVPAYTERLDVQLRRLRDTFDAVRTDGFTPAHRDAVLAFGEQASVPIATLALRDAGLDSPFTDATALVATDDAFGGANVDRPETTRRVREWYTGLAPSAVPVLAGFIGSAASGATTTLGFEGSDYSAALVAQMLGARCLTRYTDVDALYTDDPNTNAAAQRLDTLTMERAYAMTESGRLGMHPKTLRPLVDAGIPMQVRCIDDPAAPGTRILADGTTADDLIPQ